MAREGRKGACSRDEHRCHHDHAAVSARIGRGGRSRRGRCSVPTPSDACCAGAVRGANRGGSGRSRRNEGPCVRSGVLFDEVPIRVRLSLIYAQIKRGATKRTPRQWGDSAPTADSLRRCASRDGRGRAAPSFVAGWGGGTAASGGVAGSRASGQLDLDGGLAGGGGSEQARVRGGGAWRPLHLGGGEGGAAGCGLGRASVRLADLGGQVERGRVVEYRAAVEGNEGHAAVRGRLGFLPRKEALALGATRAPVEECVAEPAKLGALVQRRIGKRPVDRRGLGQPRGKGLEQDVVEALDELRVLVGMRAVLIARVDPLHAALHRAVLAGGAVEGAVAQRVAPLHNLQVDDVDQLLVRRPHALGREREEADARGPAVALVHDGGSAAIDAERGARKKRAAKTTDNPSGSSRGKHNYPSPNAARTRTQAAVNRCRGGRKWSRVALGAFSPVARQFLITNNVSALLARDAKLAPPALAPLAVRQPRRLLAPGLALRLVRVRARARARSRARARVGVRVRVRVRVGVLTAGTVPLACRPSCPCRWTGTWPRVAPAAAPAARAPPSRAARAPSRWCRWAASSGAIAAAWRWRRWWL
eukprot:scaffold15534_cov57-Phaeocystis_antarctica.AAC.7